MKGKLLLAEHATGHPDGTISILRAGISNLWVQEPPYQFQGTLVAQIDADPADVAPNHTIELRCMDEDGAQVGPQIQGTFAVPQGGGTSNIIIGFAHIFGKLGKYAFILRVNNNVLDRCTLTVGIAPKEATS